MDCKCTIATTYRYLSLFTTFVSITSKKSSVLLIAQNRHSTVFSRSRVLAKFTCQSFDLVNSVYPIKPLDLLHCRCVPRTF